MPPEARGGAWAEDHTIIAVLTRNGRLSLIPDGGGTPQALELVQGEGSRLPAGKGALFSNVTGRTADGVNIDVISCRDRRRKTLVRGGTFGHYLSATNNSGGTTGYLVYDTKRTLFAMPFDPGRLEPNGTPRPCFRTSLTAQVPARRSSISLYPEPFLYRSGAIGLVNLQ